MSRIQCLLWLAGLSLIAPALPAAAQTYDAATDFLFSSNTATNRWQYGFAADLGGAFTLFDRPFGGANDARGWGSNQINTAGTPVIYRNDSSSPILGTPVGGVAMHAGPAGSIGDYAVLRFLVPTTGNYNLSAQFFEGDRGNTDAYILLNSLAGSPIFSAASTTSNPSYVNTLSLTAGDRLDFVIGTGGDNFEFDTTPVAITLSTTSVTVPEAGAGSLLGSGILTLAAGGFLIRRRTHAAG